MKPVLLPPDCKAHRHPHSMWKTAASGDGHPSVWKTTASGDGRPSVRKTAASGDGCPSVWKTAVSGGGGQATQGFCREKIKC